MKTAGIIPARYESTRLPGKPLLKDTGKYLIQHVWERCTAAKTLDTVIIATDDKRILEAGREFGADVRMTSSSHATGTDRIAEIAANLDCEIVVNIQGDEPEIEPQAIDAAVNALANSDAVMATLGEPSNDSGRAADPNLVKIVCDRYGNALYFSRSPVPHYREKTSEPRYLFHVGLYAYRREFLLKYAKLPHTPLEQAEKLEQLRALEHGFRIRVIETHYKARGIDTPADYAAFLERHKRSSH